MSSEDQDVLFTVASVVPRIKRGKRRGLHHSERRRAARGKSGTSDYLKPLKEFVCRGPRVGSLRMNDLLTGSKQGSVRS